MSAPPLALLLVEDHPVAPHVRRGLHAEPGVQLTHAPTVREALERLAADGPFDCVLVDHLLPDGEGIEVLRAARRAACPAPTIVLATRGDEQLAVALMKAGAADYLTRSERGIDLLLRRITHVVQAHRAERLAEEVAVVRQQRAQIVEALNRLGVQLTAELAVDGVIARAAEEATSLLGASCGAYFGAESEGHAPPRNLVGSVPDGFRPEHPLLASTLRERAVIRVDDLPAERPDAPAPLRSYLAVPVISRAGEVSGGLFFGHPAAGAFGNFEQDLATGIARWTAVAVDNARLYEAAHREAQLRDDVLAIVSHDLRDPLQTISLANGLLLRRGAELPERVVHQLEVVDRSARRMSRLITDLLTVARIRSATLVVEPDDHPAHELIEEAIEALSPLARAGGVELRGEAPTSPATVRADRVRVLQVLSNLVSNAIRYSPKEAPIVVGARSRPAGVEFWVQDRGPGIAQDDLAHLFERFWRGQRPRGGGVGIGLAIVKGIVEAHGSTIEVLSDPIRGSRFSFVLSHSLAR